MKLLNYWLTNSNSVCHHTLRSTDIRLHLNKIYVVSTAWPVLCWIGVNSISTTKQTNSRIKMFVWYKMYTYCTLIVIPCTANRVKKRVWRVGLYNLWVWAQFGVCFNTDWKKNVSAPAHRHRVPPGVPNNSQYCWVWGKTLRHKIESWSRMTEISVLCSSVLLNQ